MRKILLVIAAALAAPSIAAAEPTVLIIDMSGTSTPKVEAFDELDAGAVVTLGALSKIALTFYPTCEELTIQGGTIRIMDDHLTIDDSGKVIAHSKGACPGAVSLTAVDIINAAIITRAAPKDQPKIALRPVIGLVGITPGAYDTMSIRSSNGWSQTLPINGRRIAWPAGMPPLNAGGRYIVTITGPDVQPFAAKVTAVEDAPGVTLLQPK